MDKALDFMIGNYSENAMPIPWSCPVDGLGGDVVWEASLTVAEWLYVCSRIAGCSSESFILAVIWT